MIAIIKKEMRTYFTSVIGYVFLGLFVFIVALNFGSYNVDAMSPYFSSALTGSLIMYLVLIPALTMRLFADEMRQKTDQLLFTSPVTIGKIVIGKYFAALLLYVIAMLIVMIFPVIMSNYGEIPWGETFGVLCGFLLLGACMTAIGLFVSSLTESQIVAFVASAAAIFVFFMIEAFASTIPNDRTTSIIFLAIIGAIISYLIYDSTKNIIAGIITFVVAAVIIAILYFVNNLLFDGLVYNILTWFSLLSRFSNFSVGILNLADIVYFVTFAAAFVYMTVNTIEKRRWK